MPVKMKMDEFEVIARKLMDEIWGAARAERAHAT
jgi:hypothetical protein